MTIVNVRGIAEPRTDRRCDDRMTEELTTINYGGIYFVLNSLIPNETNYKWAVGTIVSTSGIRRMDYGRTNDNGACRGRMKVFAWNEDRVRVRSIGTSPVRTSGNSKEGTM